MLRLLALLSLLVLGAGVHAEPEAQAPEEAAPQLAAEPASPPVAPQATQPAQPQLPVPDPQQTFESFPIAVLQGLDKPNARVQKIELPVGKEGSFGPLGLKVKACKKTPPEETPEAVAFLEIEDTRVKDVRAAQLFSGWMFASSPALSALEHPTYDVWLLDCKNPETKADSSSAAPAEKKAVPSKAKRKR